MFQTMKRPNLRIKRFIKHKNREFYMVTITRPNEKERFVMLVNGDGKLYLLTILKNISRNSFTCISKEIIETILNFDLNLYMEK